MKNFFLICINLALIVSCATGAKVPEENKNAGSRKTVILDWQNKDEDAEIPQWVTYIAQSEKNAMIKELGIEDYKVWTVSVSGDNLENLELFEDVAAVTEEISREMTLGINELNISNNTLKKVEMLSVQELISESQIRGLQKANSFWIKTGTPKKGVKKAKKESDYKTQFNYYSVWIMDPALYEIQLKNISNQIK